MSLELISKHKDESVNIIFKYEKGKIPDNLHAIYKIVKRDTDEIIETGSLELSEDKTSFILNIPVHIISKLEIGSKYNLIVLIHNEDYAFSQRIFKSLLHIESD